MLGTDLSATVQPLRVAFLPRYRGNPYLTLLERHLRAVGVEVVPYGGGGWKAAKGLMLDPPEVLHLHWLDAFFASRWSGLGALKMCAFETLLRVLRRRRVRIVWTAHNLRDHEGRNPRLDHRCTRSVLRLADSIIVHSPTAAKALSSAFGVSLEGRLHVVSHGHLCDCYPNTVDRSEARRELGIDAGTFVYGFLGQIRPYKGVLELIDTFRALDAPDVGLLVAGKVRDRQLGRQIQDRTATDRRIRFDAGFVPDERVQVHLNASDVIVLPYREVLTSGAAVLAMSFGRPCIAPRIGCLVDVFDAQGAFLYDAHDAHGLGRAMRRALERRTHLPAMGSHNLRRARGWNWDQIAEQTLDAYVSDPRGSIEP